MQRQNKGERGERGMQGKQKRERINTAEQKARGNACNASTQYKQIGPCSLGHTVLKHFAMENENGYLLFQSVSSDKGLSASWMLQ